MKPADSITIDEFSNYTIFSGNHDGYHKIIRHHPYFGRWEERSIDLSHIQVYEHKVNLNHAVGVRYSDQSMQDVVNHCMCVNGSLSVRLRQCRFEAGLTDRRYHYLTTPEDDILMAMSKNFYNIHIKINRDYYAHLLGDSDEKLASVRDQIQKREAYYPGNFSLTRDMVQTIHEVFNCGLGGSLKKILTEAKIHELIALQLGNSLNIQTTSKPDRKKDILFAIHEYLQQNFLEDHTLKDLCRKFGINEFDLKRQFKELFHTTVFEFLFCLRMEYARTLLLDTDTAIHEVGSKVGYKYPGHFSTAFKKKFGITPKQLIS